MSVSQATHGIFSEEYIRYYLPQERGWAYVNGYMLSQGIDCVWPSSTSTKEGVFWKKLKEKIFGK